MRALADALNQTGQNLGWRARPGWLRLRATAPTTVKGIEKHLGSAMIRCTGPVCPNVEWAFYATVFDISVEEPIAIKSRPRNVRIAPHRYS
jgi:hypothetical protein